jgi:hypothetical protein
MCAHINLIASIERMGVEKQDRLQEAIDQRKQQLSGVDQLAPLGNA